MTKTSDFETLRLRARVLSWLRTFMAQRGVLEVQTPLLSAAANSDPQIESFETHYQGPVSGGAQRRYLRTSPEFPLKRLLAAGVGDCYELGPVFRNGEFGRRHNPEFMMLEWYRVGFDHQRLADEVVELISGAMSLAGRSLSLQRISYEQLFRQHLDIDPLRDSNARLHEQLSRRGGIGMQLDRDGMLDFLLSHCIVPTFPDDQLLVLSDFPASQAALARLRAGDPPVAERFEAYVGVHELANGYHELRDADEQRRRFEADLQRRRAAGQHCNPLDQALLGALEKGLPDCAGVALGVDRLLQMMLDAPTVAEVMSFGFDQA